MLDRVDDVALSRLAESRPEPGERAWLLAAEAGRALRRARAGGRDLTGIVNDVNATIVIALSEGGQ